VSAAAPDGSHERPPSLAERLAIQQKLGGVAPALLTAVFALLMGGVVVAATGRNPIDAYTGIAQGAGLTWFFHLPWDTSTDSLVTYNLTQTLLQTSSLILTGLAVGFAFRCGLFNIGAQGQYMVGLIVANWVGISLVGTSSPVHILIAVGAATLAGAVWAGIAGILRATVGAHEVISTIMLNWVAYWFGSYVFGQGGPLQNPETPSNPISADVVEGARLPVWWGDPVLQGLHIGFFVALVALVVYWIVLNRTTLGYEVRAVGYNPDAAAYGRVSVARSLFLAMAISGAFAGLAGGLDMLGYLFHFGTLDVQSNAVGFMAIAVALLGRSSAVGIFFSALLFGGLLYGTTKGLDPAVFDPTLAGNLTSMIQGLVVLFVGADVLILWLWNLRRKRFRARVQVSPGSPV
jgi:ABC-type uncharacterized transport system permease subunit